MRLEQGLFCSRPSSPLAVLQRTSVEPGNVVLPGGRVRRPK